MIKCPQCLAAFDMLEDGQLVLGADNDGLYLEHVPCGYKGRPPGGTHSVAITIELGD